MKNKERRRDYRKISWNVIRRRTKPVRAADLRAGPLLTGMVIDGHLLDMV